MNCIELFEMYYSPKATVQIRLRTCISKNFCPSKHMASGPVAGCRWQLPAVHHHLAHHFSSNPLAAAAIFLTVVPLVNTKFTKILLMAHGSYYESFRTLSKIMFLCAMINQNKIYNY